MKIVDLSHTISIRTPGWVGYAGNKMYYYAQRLRTVGIVARRIETSLHAGKRRIAGAFPWRYEGLWRYAGLESCPCRLLAIFHAGDAPVEALGDAAPAIKQR